MAAPQRPLEIRGLQRVRQGPDRDGRQGVHRGDRRLPNGRFAVAHTADGSSHPETIVHPEERLQGRGANTRVRLAPEGRHQRAAGPLIGVFPQGRGRQAADVQHPLVAEREDQGPDRFRFARYRREHLRGRSAYGNVDVLQRFGDG